jgi:cyclohexanone monooxygenase
MSLTQGLEMPSSQAELQEYDAVIVGAGFSGMYALYRLGKRGLKLKTFEAGEGPGGTWYWNRYPGARVDIESMIYSYSFDEDLQQEWRWPEYFSPQKDLEEYANHVADRFGLREQIQFGTTVNRMRFDEVANRWHVYTDRGDHVVAKYVIAATGSLNATNVPNFKGVESFAGEWYHTSRWPKEGVDFAGKRVGVIGTGSTGIQVIPEIAELADHLYVFQRTANFSIPSYNRELDPEYERSYKDNYAERRRIMREAASFTALLASKSYDSVFDVDDVERERILNEAWQSRSGYLFIATFGDIRTNLAANEVVSEFVRNKIRGIVKDPDTAELLCPTTHPIGMKRLCMDTGYFETYNRDNVTLVDVRSHPIVEITPTGVKTTEGEYDVDILVYATGFDAMTGALTRMNITGNDGVDLRDKWVNGPTNYLGLMVAGFPNLFMIHGPGSPSVLAQMIMAGEWQVDWIDDFIAAVDAQGYARVETTPDWEEKWHEKVEAAADKMLFKRADSWYMGANIEGKPRVFMVFVGGWDTYCKLCNDAVANDFEGFTLTY